MSKMIKSQSFDSPKELEVINPINSKNVELWIYSGTGKAMNIVISRDELLEAVNNPVEPFEFPTEIGSRIKGIHSQDGETVEFLRYADNSLLPCWVMIQNGSKWETESIYDWITNLEVIK